MIKSRSIVWIMIFPDNVAHIQITESSIIFVGKIKYQLLLCYLATRVNALEEFLESKNYNNLSLTHIVGEQSAARQPDQGRNDFSTHFCCLFPGK